MPSVTFPGKEFPPLPQLTLDVPDGWQPVYAAGVLLAMAAPDSPGTFRANVTVSLSRFPAGYQLTEAAHALDASIEHLTDREHITVTVIDLAGSPAYVREVAYVDQQAGTLFQSHLLTDLHHEGVVDLVHVTATCAGADAAAEVQELRNIVKSLQIEPAVGQ